jgi:hypothetical protein
MLKTYEVTFIPKYPPYGDTGSTVTVNARNVKEAISEARKINARRMDYDRHDGPLVYTARQIS